MYEKQVWLDAIGTCDEHYWDETDIRENGGPLATEMFQWYESAKVGEDECVLYAAIDAAEQHHGPDWSIEQMDTAVMSLHTTLNERPGDLDPKLTYVDGSDGYVYVFVKHVYKTHDGVEITEGLRVMTNEAKWGIVGKPVPYTPGWFDVHYEDGGKTMMNGERMRTTPIPGLRQ